MRMLMEILLHLQIFLGYKLEVLTLRPFQGLDPEDFILIGPGVQGSLL